VGELRFEWKAAEGAPRTPWWERVIPPEGGGNYLSDPNGDPAAEPFAGSFLTDRAQVRVVETGGVSAFVAGPFRDGVVFAWPRRIPGATSDGRLSAAEQQRFEWAVYRDEANKARARVAELEAMLATAKGAP
jgi:hypothetical protein